MRGALQRHSSRAVAAAAADRVVYRHCKQAYLNWCQVCCTGEAQVKQVAIAGQVRLANSLAVVRSVSTGSNGVVSGPRRLVAEQASHKIAEWRQHRGPPALAGTRSLRLWRQLQTRRVKDGSVVT
jgi:hypothetical protein